MQNLLPLPDMERLEVFVDVRGPRLPKGTTIPEKVRNMVADIELGQLQPRLKVDGRSMLLYLPATPQGQTNFFLWWAAYLAQLSAVRVAKLNLSLGERQASEEGHMALGRGRQAYFGPEALLQAQPQAPPGDEPHPEEDEEELWGENGLDEEEEEEEEP